ncbi:hypothetical protein J5N97_000819 [Dioscorea zingiberensis]|uniref:Myb/SANT-like domain-containing protein n=1 Tax=Dioscorea zingiberensis TaxID=325984 RepID=A0A9D5BUY2_9LILI|nr:hypothetical protein J5N97_000819 [Dioscorea zingiberensis]
MASEGKIENRAKWMEIHKAHLVKLLAEYNTPAYRSQNGWTKEAWNKILHNMKSKFSNPSYTIIQVKALEQELKKAYKILKTLSELSGFGWDYEGHVVYFDDVWAPLLERNRDARKWYKKPFPYFLALQDVYEGRYAEGKRSRGIEDYEVISESPVRTPTPTPVTPNYPTQASPIPETEEDDNVRVEPPCTQPHVPQTQGSSSELHPGIRDHDGQKRKRIRKGKKPQDSSFNMEKYIAFRERENQDFIDVIKTTQVVEKHTIGDCMTVFNTIKHMFTGEEMFKATQIFVKDKSYRELFLCFDEEDRVPWLKMMFQKMD